MKHLKNYSVIILRTTLGLIMLSHGVVRIFYSSVNDFGAFLSSKGFLFGINIAWTITLLDILMGISLILGYFIKCISIWFSFVLLMGIILVHFQNGWFVVGHGQGGIEYSSLLITCFVILINENFNKKNLNN